jgi:hypothetical protein
MFTEVEVRMQDSNNASPGWFKSSRSNPGGCVEVRFIDDFVQVRDSKDPKGPILTFTDREWTAFLEGVRFNEFDHQ